MNRYRVVIERSQTWESTLEATTTEEARGLGIQDMTPENGTVEAMNITIELIGEFDG